MDKDSKDILNSLLEILKYPDNPEIVKTEAIEAITILTGIHHTKP